MYASTVGGGAMTLVFKPKDNGSQEKSAITRTKLPLRPVKRSNSKAG